MAVGFGVACPRPVKGSTRRARLTDRLKRGKQFRDQVWDRVLEQSDDHTAVCAVCGRGPLLRTLDVLHPQAGHVAHAKGRRVDPANRFNPDAAQLQCRDCHLASHHMRFA